MISPHEFLESVKRRGVEFFTGVPDSLLANLLAAIDSLPAQQHLICANEGAAVAAAAGYHLATSTIPLVYMQNSGLGNAVNPLLSLAHPKVYRIPMLIVVGWRGEPGVHDEPQHQAGGECTRELLATLGLQYEILEAGSDVQAVLDRSLQANLTGPRALLVKKNTFGAAPGDTRGTAVAGDTRGTAVAGDTRLTSTETSASAISRAGAIEVLLRHLSGNEAIVCTTGYASRELLMKRQELNLSDHADFLNVGAMGHASQIALGIAIGRSERTVICLDGDGSAIMHLGSLAVIGQRKPANFQHIILNNCCHESVGGQPTAGGNVSFSQIAAACGYAYTHTCAEESQLSKAVADLLAASGPALLEVVIRPGIAGQLPRPDENFQKRKESFMKFLVGKRMKF